MGARTFAAIVSAVIVAALPSRASAQEMTDGPLAVWNPVIAASLERIASASPSWRGAIEAVAATRRRAIITTSDTIKGADLNTLAQVQPLAVDGSRLDMVVVIVNLELLQRLSRLPVSAADFEDDLDRILAHEVYGHAIPLLLAGTLAGNCADPAVGQSAVASCAVQRENVIRKELRLGQRVEYGRDSLALAQRSQQ